MVKDIWFNLPVKDIIKSKTFFTALGFSFNEKHGNTDHSACLLVGEKKVVVMLFLETVFKSFTKNEIPNTNFSTEVLLSIGADSREEVGALFKKAVEAGGKIISEPSENGMYGGVFADLDGHQWNVMYMNF